MLTIRPIQPAEWREYRRLRLCALQDAPESFGSTYAAEATRQDEAWAARLQQAHLSDRDAALFAECGSTICGLAWCKILPHTPEVANLYQMWVAPETRGIGAGSQLLEAAIVWASQAGANVMRLSVTVADSPAMRLYVRRGFAKIGEVEPLRVGSSISAQAMELKLSSSAA
jgi:ribosomal protein S18 acetylase RimI-like enzyme